MPTLDERFHAVCLKLWGKEEGQNTYQWIKSTRPPHFHALAMQVMTPIWESDRLDLRTRILCCIAIFTALNRSEVRFFMNMAAHHQIPREEVEEVLLLTGLEAGFPTAEMAVQLLVAAYSPKSEG